MNFLQQEISCLFSQEAQIVCLSALHLLSNSVQWVVGGEGGGGGCPQRLTPSCGTYAWPQMTAAFVTEIITGLNAPFFYCTNSSYNVRFFTKASCWDVFAQFWRFPPLGQISGPLSIENTALQISIDYLSAGLPNFWKAVQRLRLLL